jgi:hypothetical protein
MRYPSLQETADTPGRREQVTISVPHDQIEALAYELWQMRGCPEGSPEEDWLRAEKWLRDRTDPDIVGPPEPIFQIVSRTEHHSDLERREDAPLADPVGT